MIPEYTHIQSEGNTYKYMNNDICVGIYTGDLENDKPHGNGKFIYIDNKALHAYDGNWKNGTYDGKGILMFANGDEYTGEWKDGKQHGHGIYKYANGHEYTGEWKDGKKHGHGTYKDANGEYTGEWNDGKKHGHGVLICVNKNKYDGEWNDGKKHGNGTYKYASGNEYTGEWNDGKKHGHGVLICVNKNKYDGEWKDGKKHGNGTFTFANGDEYTGEWKDGKQHGHGRFTHPDKTYFEREWQDSRPLVNVLKQEYKKEPNIPTFVVMSQDLNNENRSYTYIKNRFAQPLPESNYCVVSNGNECIDKVRGFLEQHKNKEVKIVLDMHGYHDGQNSIGLGYQHWTNICSIAKENSNILNISDTSCCGGATLDLRKLEIDQRDAVNKIRYANNIVHDTFIMYEDNSRRFGYRVVKDNTLQKREVMWH